MRYIFYFLFLTLNAWSQNSKPVKYYDEDSNELTEQQFNARPNQRGIWKIENRTDSTIERRIVMRASKSVMSEVELSNLYTYLKTISGRNLDISKPIVIDYIKGDEIPNLINNRAPWEIYNRDYLRKLNRITPVEHLYVYKFDKYLRYHHSDRLDWYSDKDNNIERLFSPYALFKNFVVIIQPSGKYHLILGEHRKDEVWSALKNMINGN